VIRQSRLLSTWLTIRKNQSVENFKLLCCGIAPVNTCIPVKIVVGIVIRSNGQLPANQNWYQEYVVTSALRDALKNLKT